MNAKINISKQQLILYDDNKLIKIYSISTAKNGVGGQKNSGKTPLGMHIVRAKIGEGEPINTVFVGRRKTGEIFTEQLASQYPERDWVLTRIIWLSGLEKGKNRLGNVDSMQRYIYIHGTPNAEPMGEPLSHGCIRMRADDLIELFTFLKVTSKISIEY